MHERSATAAILVQCYGITYAQTLVYVRLFASLQSSQTGKGQRITKPASIVDRRSLMYASLHTQPILRSIRHGLRMRQMSRLAEVLC
jgi:hypothetical protein